MACDKRTFSSKNQAHRAVQTMGQTIRVYYCEECRGYHTTKERGGQSGRAWGHKKARGMRHDRLSRKNKL